MTNNAQSKLARDVDLMLTWNCHIGPLAATMDGKLTGAGFKYGVKVGEILD